MDRYEISDLILIHLASFLVFGYWIGCSMPDWIIVKFWYPTVIE